MAIFSFSVKPVSRLKGESVVRAAAYISRGNLYGEREDERFDYTAKTDLVNSGVILPDNAPQRFYDRQELWNEVDRVEKRCDARLGRAVVGALPRELSGEEQIRMVNDFVREAFVSLGMCVDVAIHDKDDGNPHFHALLTDRPIDNEGFCQIKNRDWNKKIHVLQWRELWENTQNRELERKGLEKRISRESLEVQGINREPTRHLGRSATEMDRRGIRTDRGDENHAIESRNREREERQQQRDRTFERSR
jgi:ATP-dependent exoDNAse (exonuclease V) alpha subunit